MTVGDKIRAAFQSVGRQLPEELNELLVDIHELGTGPLQDEACGRLQVAVCRYVDRVALRQKALGEAIGRTMVPPVADVVTEAMNIAVQVLVAADPLGSGVQVSSERSVLVPTAGGKNERKKPDVSVWRGRELCLVVECKSNLGWNRDGWRDYYDGLSGWYRQFGLEDQEVVLLVATESNIRQDQGLDGAPGERKLQWLSLARSGSWFGKGSWLRRKGVRGDLAAEPDDDVEEGEAIAERDLAEAPTPGAFVALRDLIRESLRRTHPRTYPKQLAADMESILKVLGSRPCSNADLTDELDGVGDRRSRVNQALDVLKSEGRVFRPRPRQPWALRS